MVVLYSGGTRIGSLPGAAAALADLVARNVDVEFCDDSGKRLGKYIPDPADVSAGPLVPWEPDLTWEDLVASTATTVQSVPPGGAQLKQLVTPAA